MCGVVGSSPIAARSRGPPPPPGISVNCDVDTVNCIMYMTRKEDEHVLYGELGTKWQIVDMS